MNTDMNYLKLFFSLFVLSWCDATAQAGKWSFSPSGLPMYQYTGSLPVKAVDKTGKDAQLPDDPYFLLGNYRLTLFAHASGRYQFLTGERAWARVNATPQVNYGWNDASIAINGGVKTGLVGLQSLAADTAAVQKQFGVGFAKYTYALKNELSCTRVISVKPSMAINTGTPAFVVTVIVENKGRKKMELVYNERMLVNYTMVATQFAEKSNRPVLYPSRLEVDAGKETALARVSFQANTLLAVPGKENRFQYDVAPPTVFMYAKHAPDGSYNSTVKTVHDTLATEVQLSLNPGETKTFHVITGLTDDEKFASVAAQAAGIMNGASLADAGEGLFVKQWKTRLPDLSAEPDAVLRREMLWNAHAIEAMATYSAYYKETFIPQGTVYAWHFGDNISNRDHLQAALPACYTNPALAKSCIRYVMKHAEADGEIKRGDAGVGYTPPSLYKESDEQLYFFNTLAEYLLITKDFDFLKEQVGYYPAEDGHTDLLLNILKKFFIYLRDEIGLGPDGLVKMLNSDWSDSFFHEYSPNKFSWSAQSHLNSAMVLAILPKLIQALNQSGNADTKTFVAALENYRAGIDQVFMKDLGDRKFAARAYLSNSIRFGLDNVCIEPQGYLLQIPTISKDRKKEIYDHIKAKNLSPEQIGFRTRERPVWGKPEGEDGGIWYSLEYPVLLGVATFDRAEAWSLMKKFSFQNFAARYPNYWVGQWTAPDNINSTLSTREGLYSFWEPDIRRSFQGYCCHPHAWPLFCYYKLKENKE